MNLKLFKRYFLFATMIASFVVIPVACSSDDGGGDPPVVEEAKPDPANANTTITADSPVSADGTASSKVTVKIADTAGKPMTKSAGTVTLTTTGAATLSAVTDNKDGTYSATVTDTVAEKVTISGKLGDAALADTAEIDFEAAVGPADPTNANTTINATAPTTEAGVSTSTVTVQLADADGVLLKTSGGTVALTSTGSATLTDDGVIDNEDGTYTATVTNTVQENVTISGTLDGVAITSTTDITFNPDDANPALEGVAQTEEENIIGTSILRINSGGGEVTLDGKVFMADQYFDVDNTVAYTNPEVTEIEGTEDDALYLSERITKDGTNIKGPFSYRIPVSNGTYTVKLYFAEIYWGSPNPQGLDGDIGKRIFNVSMEDTQIFAGYDLVKDVDPRTASSRMYDIEVTDGELTITFEASVNKPKISGIEVFGTGTIGDGM